jgi:hypothetical protein
MQETNKFHEEKAIFNLKIAVLPQRNCKNVFTEKEDFSLRSKRQGDAGMPRYRSAGQGRKVAPSPHLLLPQAQSQGSHTQCPSDVIRRDSSFSLLQLIFFRL